MTIIERRIFLIGAIVSLVGTVVCAFVFGFRIGASFLAGSLLGALSLAWLRWTVTRIVFTDPRGSVNRVIVGFILRLLLIPLCLYAMIRFLLAGVVAAVAGFALFICGIFIEGVYEALKKPKKNA
jgi:hypothetical protein